MNTSTAFKVNAHAKINLFLEVLGKRPDYYHEISSVMIPVALHDELQFEKTDNAVELTCSTEDIPSGDDNIIIRAARLLRSTYNVKAGVKITLDKRIPVAAGLGGGSSDAAATLLSLNQLWKLELGLEELVSLAGALGADVSFFMHGRTAHVSGIGEKVVELENNLGNIHIVLAFPGFGISTRAVYTSARVPSTEQRRSASGMIDGFLSGEVELVLRNVYNRLQEAAIHVEPRLEDFYNSLADTTDLPVTMSGSGSTFFVCCKSSHEADNISKVWENIRATRVYVTESLANGCPVAAIAEMA